MVSIIGLFFGILLSIDLDSSINALICSSGAYVFLKGSGIDDILSILLKKID
jgi:hypothetical protein